MLADIRKELVKAFKDSLEKKYAAKTDPKQRSKVVTRKTQRSIEERTSVNGDGVRIEVWAAKSWKYIRDGRKANGKFPVFKKGGKFVLFPELEDWKRKVGYKGSDYMLAKGIAKRGILPSAIDDTAIGLFESRTNVESALISYTINSKDFRILESLKDLNK